MSVIEIRELTVAYPQARSNNRLVALWQVDLVLQDERVDGHDVVDREVRHRRAGALLGRLLRLRGDERQLEVVEDLEEVRRVRLELAGGDRAVSMLEFLVREAEAA